MLKTRLLSSLLVFLRTVENKTVSQITAGPERSEVFKSGYQRLVGSPNFLFALFWVLALLASIALAQDEVAAFKPNPLRPVDTSSPRDTLYSFIHHFDAAVEAWRAEKEVERRRAVRRANKTIDFSDFPTRGYYIRTFEKMALLNEILDRIELPSCEQIPGDEELANEEIARWVIPDTEIEIARLEEGPQAGQFLFTKATVAGLEEYYEAAKDLPYRPDADVDLYSELLVSPGPLISRRWVEALPSWAYTIVFGHGVWQWMMLAAIVLIAVLLVRLLYRWGWGWDERFKDGGNARMRFGVPLALLGIIVIAFLVR